jgi:hypothetical protein
MPWNEKKTAIRSHLKNIHKACMELQHTFEKVPVRHCHCNEPSHRNLNPTYSSRGSDQGVVDHTTKRIHHPQRPQTTSPSLNQPSLACGIDYSEPSSSSLTSSQLLLQQTQRPQTTVIIPKQVSPMLSIDDQSEPIFHNPFPIFSPDRRDRDSMTADLLLLTKHRSTSKVIFNKASGGFVQSRYIYDDSMGGSRRRRQSRSMVYDEQEDYSLDRAASSGNYDITRPNAVKVGLSYSEWNVQHPAFPVSRRRRKNLSRSQSRSSLIESKKTMGNSISSRDSGSGSNNNMQFNIGDNFLDFHRVHQTKKQKYKKMKRKKEAKSMHSLRRHREQERTKGEIIYGVGYYTLYPH